MNRMIAAVGVMVAIGVFGCASPEGDTRQDKRQYVLNMRDDALEDLYKERPEARDRIAQESGYAVFSNIGTNVLLVETGGGYGVVHDNTTGKDTFMRAGAFGVGPGIGVTDFRAVYVFTNDDVLRDFINEEFRFGGKAQATAKSGDEGGDATAAGDPESGVIVYEFTKNGVAVSATVRAARYWQDDALND